MGLLGQIRARLHLAVLRTVWGMDIHATCWIDPTASIDRTWPKGVHIGAGTVVGEHAILLTHDFTRGVYLETRVGTGCVIGPRAIILPGISLGDHCVVMPGAVVNRDAPSGAFLAGNPAVIVDGQMTSQP
jgi:acetyltransferase-like isoleucine patch superfamily enzyme